MACNSCAKPFNLLRKEKGCPGCGFSYCSSCLDNKIYLKKVQSEAKVCLKCKKSAESCEPTKIEPPSAYFKRLEEHINKLATSSNNNVSNSKDAEIQDRLLKLKGDKDSEIKERLKNIKGEIPTTSNAEIEERLAKLRGVPVSTITTKPVTITPDLRTEEEQADSLLKQYLKETEIDTQYKDEFDNVLNTMEARLAKLKGKDTKPNDDDVKKDTQDESEDEEETVRKIIEKYKAEVSIDDQSDDIKQSIDEELPFCEICNEDASMRCLGCKYLFCKRCFLDHKDDDDGCNRYEPYKPLKSSD